MMTRIPWAAAILIGLSARAASECAMPIVQTVSSPNGRHSLTLNPDGSFKLDGKPGSIKSSGHHWDAFLSNDGKQFVVADRYVGLFVFGQNGEAKSSWKAEELCWKTSDAWACHTEGQWYRDATRISPDRVVFDVGFGPDVSFEFSENSPRLRSDPAWTLGMITGIGLVTATATAFAIRRSRRRSSNALTS